MEQSLKKNELENYIPKVSELLQAQFGMSLNHITASQEHTHI